ncbi:MAG: cytidylate kinase family protein [Desulfobacterales bacterium]|jgi:cytidylate kinase
MPIITISRGSYSKGKEVAEKVAHKLGYECVSRDIILEASEEFHVPEIKLIRAIHDAPGILNRLSHEKDKYIAYIQTALLKHFRKDNIVYHGLAGHFFVKGISHVLKVRIIADIEERVKLEMEREKIGWAEALQLLKKDDEERRKWSQHLYGLDPWDSSLYDMVLHIHTITVDDAVDVICHTAGVKDFQATPESKKAMDDLVLATEVRSAVIDLNHGIKISARDGIVFVKSEATPLQQSPLIHDIEKIVKEIPGVKDMRIDVEPIFPLSE